jgi:hypothetical protein
MPEPGLPQRFWRQPIKANRKTVFRSAVSILYFMNFDEMSRQIGPASFHHVVFLAVVFG